MSRLIREEDVTKHVMHAGDVAKQDPDLQVVGLGHVYSAPTVEMHLTTCGDCKYGELDIQEHGYLEPPTCVDDQPTVDAIEVVRCKDCVWNKQPQCWEPFLFNKDGTLMNYPEDEQRIFVCDGKQVWCDLFINEGEDGCWLDDTSEEIVEGMAWMPMPEPYKKGGAK